MSRLFRDVTYIVNKVRTTNHRTVRSLSTSHKYDLIDDACVTNRRPRWGPMVAGLKLKNTKPAIRAEEVAAKFNIGIERAKQTLKVTTHKGIRQSLSVANRFKTQPFRSKRVLQGKWYSDTMFFPVTSIVRGENCAQVTTNGKGFTHFLPIQSKSQAFEGLLSLINEYGIPEHIVTDGAREEGGIETWKSNWKKLIKRFYIKQTYTQPYCWWQNSAER